MDGLGSSIGGVIVGVFITACAIVFVITAGITSAIWWMNSEDFIESKTMIVPEIKLETDGKTIDTIYVYKPNK